MVLSCSLFSFEEKCNTQLRNSSFKLDEGHGAAAMLAPPSLTSVAVV